MYYQQMPSILSYFFSNIQIYKHILEMPDTQLQNKLSGNQQNQSVGIKCSDLNICFKTKKQLLYINMPHPPKKVANTFTLQSSNSTQSVRD